MSSSKIWGKINNDSIEIKSLIPNDVEEALDILDRSFFINECVSNACQINLPENGGARKELRELCRRTATDGVSLIAVDSSTGKIVAAAFNKIQYVPEKDEQPFFIDFRNNHCRTPQAQALMDFMIEVDSQKDVFELYKIDCTLELMFLATLPEYECRGIGKALAKYTIQLTRELCQGVGIERMHPDLRSKRPKGVTAIFTSLFSQKVGKATGFKVLNSVPYDKFQFNGKRYSERINPLHPTCEHVAIIF